jgi:hypothetical protein
MKAYSEEKADFPHCPRKATLAKLADPDDMQDPQRHTKGIVIERHIISGWAA